MTDNELLLAMSKQLETINKRFDKVEDRLDAMNQRFDKMDDALNTIKFKQNHMSEKLDGLETTVKYIDLNIRRDIKILTINVDTIVEILKIHNMIPIAK